MLPLLLQSISRSSALTQASKAKFIGMRDDLLEDKVGVSGSALTRYLGEVVFSAVVGGAKSRTVVLSEERMFIEWGGDMVIRLKMGYRN